MTHHTFNEILATIVLFSGTLSIAVDVFDECSKTALTVKWSLGWLIIRYLGIISGMLLALNVLW
jgi:hypothetical protein